MCDIHDGVGVSDRGYAWYSVDHRALAVVLVLMAVFFMGFFALFAGVAVVGTAARRCRAQPRKLGQ